MKYYYEKPSEYSGAGEVYICDHVLFNRCTLFRKGSRGLIVIQEHYNNKTKARWWGTVEPWLSEDIYMSEYFDDYFEENAGEKDENGYFPIVKLRKIMWAMRLKPLKKEPWES